MPEQDDAPVESLALEEKVGDIPHRLMDGLLPDIALKYGL
jgi:hypothetical protein